LKKARFNRPQGVAFDPESKILYVADTENHAIRQVHLPDFPLIDSEQLQVVTILGTGSQVQNYKAEVDESGKYGISSPWDLILCGKPKKRRLLIAMAGTHQIWDYNIHKQRATVLAGTGQERRQDSSETENAAFAQPSGLCIHPHGDSVLIADSESSSIRVVKLDDGNTTTFVGGGTDPDDLFQYGDIDEQGSVARLQHALAITFLDGAETVMIADTYNHKLKRADWSSATVKTWDIRYHDGDVTDGAAVIEMSEPSGLALSSQHKLLFVADTNNSLIRGLDIDSGVLYTVKFTEAESETTKKQKAETKTQSTKPTAASKPLVNKARATKLESRQLEIGPDCKISIERT
jgi:sugar lactone lactonase YvrE